MEGLHGRPLQLILLDRFKRFHDSCVNSSNVIVKFLALNSSSNRWSVFNRNYVYFKEQYCALVDKWDATKCAINDQLSVLRDMIDICDGVKFCDACPRFNAEYCILHICIN